MQLTENQSYPDHITSGSHDAQYITTMRLDRVSDTKIIFSNVDILYEGTADLFSMQFVKVDSNSTSGFHSPIPCSISFDLPVSNQC